VFVVYSQQDKFRFNISNILWWFFKVGQLTDHMMGSIPLILGEVDNRTSTIVHVNLAHNCGIYQNT
jgi:hypothetical protein